MQLVKDEDSTDLMSWQFLYGNHLFNKKKANLHYGWKKKSKTNLMKHQLLFYTAFFHLNLTFMITKRKKEFHILFDMSTASTTRRYVT